MYRETRIPSCGTGEFRAGPGNGEGVYAVVIGVGFSYNFSITGQDRWHFLQSSGATLLHTVFV